MFLIWILVQFSRVFADFLDSANRVIMKAPVAKTSDTLFKRILFLYIVKVHV